MADRPSTPPGAKAALILSVVLNLLGIGGMLSGYTTLELADVPHVADPNPVDVDHAREQLTVMQLQTPIAQGLAVANCLASGLLLVAGLMITIRRPTALWWTRQALWANLFYTGAAMVGRVMLTFQFTPELVQFYLLVHEEMGPMLGGGADPGTMVSAVPWMMSVGPVVAGLVGMGVYGLLLWQSRRRELKRFFEQRSS